MQYLVTMVLAVDADDIGSATEVCAAAMSEGRIDEIMVRLETRRASFGEVGI